MNKTEILRILELKDRYTDVLYLTNENRLPVEIKHLFKHRRLSYRIIPIKDFFRLRDRLDLVGTVIIDTQDDDISEPLVQIVEILENEHIGVILLTGRTSVPIKSFSLSPTETSFTLSGTTETVSIDELWLRISVNLAYRKKPTGIAAKPVILPKHMKSVFKNKLAEQLNMTKKLVDNLAEQLRLAGLVQQDFLPSKLPNSDKLQWGSIFIPTEWVSGDIYDVVRLDEEHIGFYIADVVGHGMPAALLTIFLKQAIVMRQTNGNNYEIFSPSEVVRNLNIRMAAQKLSGYQFATCCYCLLNTTTLELTYARAGHPYPILIRKNQEPTQLEIRGSLLGVFEQADFHQGTIQLEPGDKLLLYSDGADPYIGKFDNKAGFAFTKAFHALKHKSLTDMLAGFNIEIQNYEAEEAEIDDITIVGLEIKK